MTLLLAPTIDQPINMIQPVNLLHPLNIGLVAWWMVISGVSGSARFIDLTSPGPLGNHGTLIGGVNWVGTGRLAWGALDFNSTDGNVKLADNAPLPLLGDGSFTISGWAKTSSTKENQIICRRDNHQSQGGEGRLLITLDVASSTAVGDFPIFELFDNTNNPFAEGTTNVEDGVWHLLTGVRDIPADQLRIYVDGVLEDEVTDSTDKNVSTLLHPFYISEVNDVSVFDGFMDGQLDDIRMWDHALTTNEISWYYQLSQKGYPGLLNRIEGFYKVATAAAVGFPKQVIMY